MRTLTRPMFNMGGPIKQGIMNGIREPKKDGGPLVGSSAYPKTGGREHHFAVTGTVAAGVGLNAARIAATRAAMRYGPRALKYMKNWFGTTTPASVTKGGQRIASSGSYSPVTMNPAKFNPNWLGRDPVVKGLGWAGKSIFSPTAGGLAAKALRGIFSPSGIALTAGWYLWPDGSKRKTPPPGDMIGAGPLHGVKDPTSSVPGPTVKSEAQQKAFANKQREERVQKYLDLMGYDRAKKTAIADALIDASKIVGDRGTLDPKNITQELINPVIQATSKRLDKPDQIREAVGLMATKAEIEKDLSKEKDALKTKLTKLQIQDAEQTLAESASFEAGLSKFISDRKGKVDKVTLERISRLLAKEHGDPFKKVTGDEEVTVDGIYMKDGGIFRVTEGVSEQIV